MRWVDPDMMTWVPLMESLTPELDRGMDLDLPDSDNARKHQNRPHRYVFYFIFKLL